MSRPSDSQCKGPWPVQNIGSDEIAYYDQWVEPGQFRRTHWNTLALVVGALDEQDEHQHDRTIPWLVLVNDRLVTMFLGDLGEWWLVYPLPEQA